eukprot:13921435-Heterocapsa_arctica.AAC.1
MDEPLHTVPDPVEDVASILDSHVRGIALDHLVQDSSDSLDLRLAPERCEGRMVGGEEVVDLRDALGEGDRA